MTISVEIPGTDLSATQAVEQFVAEHYGGRRWEWLAAYPTRFALVDGVKVYQTEMTATGWRITEVTHAPTDPVDS